MFKKRTVVFRADGNSEIGLGHLYRLFALTELYGKERDVLFITSFQSAKDVIPNQYNLRVVPEEVSLLEEPDWLRENFSPESHLLVLDGYQFSGDYQMQIKRSGFDFMYVDDLVKGDYHADIVLNHAEGIAAKQYECKEYTWLALGTKYAILRPAFLSQAGMSRKIKKLDKAFVCFGGADMYDLSYKATRALLAHRNFEEIHVLLGAAYKHKRIFELAKENSRVILYGNLEENSVLELMKRCNFGIVPASTTLYELLTVKMPILSGFFVDNQLGVYRSFLEKNAIYGGGNFKEYSIDKFKDKIQEIVLRNDFEDMIAIQEKSFDNRIKNRLLKLLDYLSLKIEKAVDLDVDRVYEWSNDDLVRKNSYNSSKIVYENHVLWFSKIIQNPNCLFYMVKYENEYAGMVRFEVKNDHSVVGITLSKEYRGRGLASLFLIKTAKRYFIEFEKPIFAYIKEDNMPSIRVFESAGYTFFKKDKIQGVKSFIYKLGKDENI